jgi:biopolymer transport protein ExbB
MVEIVKSGGWLMAPIILCAIIAMGIILERFWTLQQKRVIPEDLTSKVWGWVKKDQLDQKQIQSLHQGSPLGQILAAGLINRDRDRAVMKESIEDTGRHVVHELERYLETLGTVAAISPLLGLLGTVIGMVKVFTAITTHGVGNPTALAGGIAEALITTAAGLTVAIPAGRGAAPAAAEGQRMRLSVRPKTQPEVNLTSLIDVVLLLLIFFMVSTSFVKQSQIQLRLPEADGPAIVEEVPDQIDIMITETGTYFINGRELINTRPETIRNALQKISGGNNQLPLTISADANARHQYVVTAMDVAGRLGFTQINIATVNDTADD